MTWPTVEGTCTYEGDFLDDLKHGQGRYTWANNKVFYVGDWERGKRCGHGVCVYPDEGRYEGTFRDNLRHGRGIFTFPDGSSYVGDWSNDLKDGKGIFTWADGNKFSGEWQKGESKSGTLVEPDGTSRKIN